MKKLIASILIACTLFTTSAYASSIDIDSMTMDELIELRDAITKKINSSYGEGAETIYQGQYAVGKTIKPGRYIIVFYKDTTVDDSYFAGEVIISENKESFDDWEYVRDDFFNFGEECYVDLKDGMIMFLNYAPAVIRPVEKPSWAP